MTATKKPARFVRMQGVAKAHPWVTWGTVAAIATILSSIAPAALWAIGHFQTTEDFKHYAGKQDQRFAWMAFSVADLKVVILRNRLNECSAKRQEKGHLLSIDSAACDSYRQEYDDAMNARTTLYNEARSSGKDK